MATAAETGKPAAIAPAPATPPQPPPDPKPTPEPPKPGAMAASASRLRSSFRGSEAQPKKEEKKEGESDPKEKPVAAPAEPAAPAAPAPAKAPAKKVIRRAAGYEPGTEKAVDKLAQAADKLADAATKVGQSAAPATPAAAPKAEFTKAEQRQLKVLEAMQELYPDRYSNIAKNAQRFIEELPEWETKWNDDFAKDWEKKNGKKFDDDDERSAAMTKARDAAYEDALESRRKQYKIDYDEEDFEDAKDHIRTKPVTEELQRTKAELEELRKDKTQRDVKPVAEEHGQLAVQDIAANLKSQLGDEFDGILAEDGSIVEEKLDLIADAPFVKRVLESTAKQAKDFAEAVVIAFNGGQTPLLPEIERFCIWAEQKKAQAPEAEQRDENGRMFAKRADYFKMTPAEQKKHWLLDAETAITMRNDEFLRAAKAGIDDARAVAAEVEAHKGKLGKARGTAPAGSEAPAPTPAPAKAASNGNKPVIATATDGPPNGKPKLDDGRSFMQQRLSQSVIGGSKTAA